MLAVADILISGRLIQKADLILRIRKFRYFEYIIVASYLRAL